MGTFFTIVSLGVLFICLYTLFKIRKIRIYCEENFDKIGKAIHSHNEVTNELTEQVKELNNNFKTNPLSPKI